MEQPLSIIAIVISLISGAFACYTFVWTRCRDRKQATLDAYNQLQVQALDCLNKYQPANVREIANDRRSEKYKELSSYIARIEHFCVGVNLKIYDRDTVYKLANGYLNGSIKIRIDPIIESKNRSDYDYYENIHKVYEWMSKKSEKEKQRASKKTASTV